MFAFCTFAYPIIAFGANWRGLLIQYATCNSMRAREDGKSSHRARYVIPIEGVVCGHHIYKRVCIDAFVGESLPVDIE